MEEPDYATRLDPYLTPIPPPPTPFPLSPPPPSPPIGPPIAPPIPSFSLITDGPDYMTLPVPSTTTTEGARESDPAPPKQTSTRSSTDTKSNPQPTRTSLPGGQQQQPSGSPAASNNGEITLQPGVPTPFRTFPNGSPSAATAAPAISGSVISGPMTGVVFAFAFLGALIIGFVAGFLVAKYTRFGGSRKGKGQKDQLTEQLRLLTETIGQRNEYQQQHQHQYPHVRTPFDLDRSYLNEDKLSHAPFQAELMPLYMNGQHAYPSVHDGGDMNRLDPQSVTDQNPYQDWDSVGTPLMPETPMISVRPAIAPTSAAVAATSRSLGAANIQTKPPAPDVEIGGPKDEWASSTGSGSLSSRNVSVSNLNEFGRGRPQMRVEGEGEDSLFDDCVDAVGHNPHAP
ncbi:hypothetical protein EC991_009479 [Linnemannia zychae]|nr:hypothetical protein EC991_009479 [Linnemannia zychae]